MADGAAQLLISPLVAVAGKGAATLPDGSAMLSRTGVNDITLRASRGFAAIRTEAAELSIVAPDAITVAGRAVTTMPASPASITRIPIIDVVERGSAAFPDGAATLTGIEPPSISLGASGSASFNTGAAVLTRVPPSDIEVFGQGLDGNAGQPGYADGPC